MPLSNTTLLTDSSLINKKIIPAIISIFFVLLTVLSIYCTIFQLRTLSVSMLPASTTIYAKPTASSKPSIASFHLFGQYEQNINFLPQTTLQLTLEGVAIAINPKGISRAIISSSGLSKIYTIGETVPGGARIKAINRTQVILEQGRQLTSLKLPIPKEKIQKGLYTAASNNSTSKFP